jgi:hypothetical protein
MEELRQKLKTRVSEAATADGTNEIAGTYAVSE